jgi:stage III sporulation protein SpoIIIAA
MTTATIPAITEIAKSRLVALAVARHGINIKPVCTRKSLKDCISIETVSQNIVVLWYNDSEINSTHVVSIPLAEAIAQ